MIAECLHPGCTRAPYAGALCAQHARLPRRMTPVPTDAFVLPPGKPRARTRPPLPPLTPVQRAEGASERLLSALRDHVAGDAAAWGRVETERALLIGAVVAAHDAGGAP